MKKLKDFYNRNKKAAKASATGLVAFLVAAGLVKTNVIAKIFCA